ncbi:MAG TPA: DUF2069 domain-containing protein [Caldimonas sp.]
MDHAAAPLAVLRGTRALAVGSTLALIALGLAWELWLAPTGRGTLAVKVLPLVLPLAGLIRMRLYTYRWTSLLVWLYVAEGAVRATSERGPGALLALVEIALSFALFVACAVHVRARLRADADGAGAALAATS